MRIEKHRLDELAGAKYNPRKVLKPGDVAYEKLRASIEAFGYVEPVIVNARNNVIVGGHQRVAVMRDLGYTEIDCVIVDLPEKEERSLNVALNKISGEWDGDLLKDLLATMDGDMFALTGFDERDLEAMLKEVDMADFDGEQPERTKVCQCPKCGFEWCEK